MSTSIQRSRRGIAAALGLAASLLMASAPAAAQTSVFVPPEEALAATGATYAGWSASWWQYVLSFPASSSPFFDASGANCATGQSSASKVFFLIGSLSSTHSDRRECVAPAGKYLFFPMVNTVDLNTPPPDETAAELFAEIKPAEDGANGLHASVDDVELGQAAAFRFPSDPARSSGFSVSLPDGNLFGLPAGTYRPSVADGYYVLVKPLPAGAHTIHFGGKDGNGFKQNITYHLTIR